MCRKNGPLSEKRPLLTAYRPPWMADSGGAKITSTHVQIQHRGFAEEGASMSLERALDLALETAVFQARSIAGVPGSRVQPWINGLSAKQRLQELSFFRTNESHRAVEAELAQHLAPFLHPITGNLGFALPYVMGGLLGQRIPDVAKNVIAAAAVVGSRATAATLAMWIDGEPARYAEVMTIRGIKLEEDLELEPGVRFVNITDETDLQAADSFPTVTHTELAGPALVVDQEIPKVFFRPPNKEIESGPPKWTGFLAPQHALDDLLNALSLACNCNVVSVHRWTRFDEVTRLMNNSGGGGMSWSTMQVPREGGALNRDKLAEVKELLPKVANNRYLALPLSRWRNSLTTRNVDDQLVDLRILLEVLYTQSAASEIAFQVALYGAWHLQSRKYFDIFHKVYTEASKVIHGGAPSGDMETRRALIADAQQGCRQAFLKRLGERRDTNFRKKVLDALLPD